MKKLLLTTSLLAISGMTLTGCQSMKKTSAVEAADATQMVADSDQILEGQRVSTLALGSTLTGVNSLHTPIGQLIVNPVGSRGANIFGQIGGLQPNATYALHIHENGNCANGGKAAGGHFNPANKPHGHPDSDDSHAGDLPNITTDASGVATVNYISDKVSVNLTAPTSIYHRSFIIHAGADDYTTQPSGNSGERIACGIIDRL